MKDPFEKFALPNARDARQAFEDGLYEKAEAQAKKISEQISNAVSEGRNSISIDGNPLEKSVASALASKGYICKYTSEQRDGSYTTISW